MSRQSHIHCELDLGADGKHAGHLRLPHSVHRSAYGWLPIPVVSVRNGDGPRLLLMAGNHGDEYEGQVALGNMARWLDAASLRGQVVILPMANFPAARAGRRTSPIDEGNLNRSFPGDPEGGPTAAIAHFLESVLMPKMDLVVDVHSGGSSLNYLPCVLAGTNDGGELDDALRQQVEAFAAPLTLLFPSRSDGRLSVSAARRAGCLGFTTEMGGAGTVDPTALQITEQGLTRVLHAMGILAQPPSWSRPARGTRYLHVHPELHYCYATEDGLVEPRMALGDTVVRGDLAALIHHPETPMTEPDRVHFPGDGMVVCQRVPGRCERGDCLFHLAGERNP